MCRAEPYGENGWHSCGRLCPDDTNVTFSRDTVSWLSSMTEKIERGKQHLVLELSTTNQVNRFDVWSYLQAFMSVSNTWYTWLEWKYQYTGLYNSARWIDRRQIWSNQVSHGNFVSRVKDIPNCIYLLHAIWLFQQRCEQILKMHFKIQHSLWVIPLWMSTHETLSSCSHFKTIPAQAVEVTLYYSTSISTKSNHDSA